MSNRYTRISTESSFNPMSLDQVMTVPLAKQAEYEAQQSKLDEYGLFDLNRMDVDDKSVKDFVGQYTDDVSSIADELGTFGNSTSVNTKARELKQRRDKYMNQSGAGYKIEDAYKRYNENVANINKQYATGNITGQEAEKAKMFAKKRYTGYQDGDYQEFTPSKTVNVRDVANKFAESIPVSEIASGQGLKEVPGYPTMYQYTDMKQQGRRRYEVDGNNMVSAQQIVAKETKEYLDNNNELQSYYGDQKLYDENFDGSGSIQAASDAAQRIYGNQSINSTTRYGNLPNDPVAKPPEENPYSKQGIYGINSMTNNIFKNTPKPEYIKSEIEVLKNKNTPESIDEARRMENHYNNAISKFNENNPEVVKANRNIKNTETGKLYDKLDIESTGLTLEEFSSLDTMFDNQFNTGKSRVIDNDDGTHTIYSGFSLNNENGRTRSSSPVSTGVTITDDQFKTLKSENSQIKSTTKRYNDELENHLINYADNSTEYLLLGVKASDNTVINRDLNTIIKASSLGNQTMNVYRFMDTDANVKEGADNIKKADKIIENIKLGNGETQLLSIVSENERGLPMIKVSYKNSDDESDNSILEIELSKNKVEGSLFDHANKYIMNAYREHGGVGGAILAERMDDRITYKDITPNSIPDFKESNAIKKVLTTGINKKLESKLGKDYKLDITRAGDKYSIIKTDGESLRWGDLFDTPEDFNTIGTTKVAQYLQDQLLKATNRKNLKDVSQGEYNSFMSNLINSNAPIRMSNYRDLLNLLNR
jgi:hypothetical protein